MIHLGSQPVIQVQAEGGAVYIHRLSRCKNTSYIRYGFKKHSKWGLRLIHDVTISDRLVPTTPTPRFVKIDTKLRGGDQAKGSTIYPSTAYQGAETHYEFVKHPKWGLRLRLISDVTTSDRSVPTPKFMKIDPKLRRLSG